LFNYLIELQPAKSRKYANSLEALLSKKWKQVEEANYQLPKHAITAKRISMGKRPEGKLYELITTFLRSIYFKA